MRTERLFGLETEYGLAATTSDGEPLEIGAAAAEMLKAARRCLPCVPGINQSGVFLGNASRFYVDCGAHPEFCTGEVSTPDEVVAYVAAGERILSMLASEVSRTRGWRVSVLRSNVDYGTEVTFGRHESYLHMADPGNLAEQLIPHIVSRVVFGAGGFDPKSKGIEFSLSPRSAFFSTVISEQSTASRGIIHTKQEPLAGLGYRRFHVICPGDTLLSQTGTYLHVATTALLVALVEAGERPGEAVGLREPVAALRTFAADPTCRAEARLKPGGSASALAIQRHYLERAERGLSDGRLPAWAPQACARWRAVLDRLEEGPDAVAGKLDWATKRIVYEAHARERGFEWDALAFWTGIAHALHAAMKRAKVKPSSCEKILGPGSPIRDEVDALTPDVTRRGESWDRLRSFADLRDEFHALDTRWGELGASGVWAGLDEEGLLSHRILDEETIESAVTTPPSLGRAKLRGTLIREAHASGSTGLQSDWDRMTDEAGMRVLDLSDPFATQVAWRTVTRSAEEGRATWLELLRRDPRFAMDHPEPFQELSALARELEVPERQSPSEPLMRRALGILERWFRADHPIVAACLHDLARQMSRGDRAAEAPGMLLRASAAERLFECRQTMGPDHPSVALACNDLAICLRSLGLAYQAEEMLREAVAIEDRALPPDHPKRPHRLNNLASVLLMQDKRAEARLLLDRAWHLQSGRHDLTSARILCLRLALEWIEGREGNPFLGQMRTLLAEPRLGTLANISTTWETAAVWESLRPRLSEGRLILLQRIADSLNDRSIEAELSDFPAWREAPAAPLDAPWPEIARDAAATPGGAPVAPPRPATPSARRR